jgi:hypothetical protein
MSGPTRFIPPGHVDAYCTTCKRDVVIPKESRVCRSCGQEVHPLSLPSVPHEPRTGTAMAHMATEPPAQIVSVLSAPPSKSEPSNGRTASEPPAERIVLPEWIDGVREWHAATRRMARQLADEEAQIVGELKRVRGLRKLLDAVLERVEMMGADP